MKNTVKKIIECVVNVSHGADDEILQQLADSIRSVQGQKLLDTDSSLSANRTVFTFAGEPEPVANAAFELMRVAQKYIDMRKHKGSHPRIGAVDVCPLVALRNCTEEEVIELANKLAQKAGNELHIPIYLYELSAQKTYRKSLPQIRKGGYENLSEKMVLSDWQPDFGPGIHSEFRESIFKTGATVLGVRRILVAFNISLKTQNSQIAEFIAYRLRTIGWPKSMKEEALKLPSKKLPQLRAIGWYSEDYRCAQVSFNFLAYQTTSPLSVWEEVKVLSAEYHTEAIGCEVIGLIPEQCLLEAGIHASQDSHSLSKEEIIETGVNYLSLNKVRAFDPKHKILEWRLEEL